MGEDFLKKWWKVFYGSALFVCGFCVLQCILDLAGCGQDVTLMCDGCTYKMFGFPHPNGFAIEPQFMGNLLIAPAIMAAWSLLEHDHNNILRGRVARARRYGARALILGRDLRKPRGILLMVVFASTLFLTFSRGAIYAFILAMVVLTVWEIWKTKKWNAMILWLVIILSFLFTLNLQGIFAQVSKTDDTYATGVAKVINHLSLGIIEIPAQNDSKITENSEAVEITTSDNEAVFDGYVAESTDVRVKLSDSALKVWSQDFKTIMFGVGIGGAGQALYQGGLSASPKEIVQNEYVSLLLETGLVGVSLAILTVVLAILTIRKEQNGMVVIVLMVAYGVTLLFFSGLPNALHIYLLSSVFSGMEMRKKLVS